MSFKRFRQWRLPPLFGLPEVTLPQGFGLFALGRLLFGGFGGGSGGARHRRMTPERRERFRERMRARAADRDAQTS